MVGSRENSLKGGKRSDGFLSVVEERGELYIKRIHALNPSAKAKSLNVQKKSPLPRLEASSASGDAALSGGSNR